MDGDEGLEADFVSRARPASHADADLVVRRPDASAQAARTDHGDELGLRDVDDRGASAGCGLRRLSGRRKGLESEQGECRIGLTAGPRGRGGRARRVAAMSVAGRQLTVDVRDDVVEISGAGGGLDLRNEPRPEMR